ncbi:hypothetical protein WISP_118411 [Willisornis vidua]|uniref:Uncharacterized protein n=1 Tax=Willisornis vidua TaxID=1566151 RepID=A0ABQ9CXV8_9PASS|nr:hypothetical protein WISP_118411 [Willisornis vidua]
MVTMCEVLNMFWGDPDQGDGTCEATSVQSPHHDAAVPGAHDGSAVPGASVDDALTEPYSIPVLMEVHDDCGKGHHPGPQGAASAPIMS